MGCSPNPCSLLPEQAHGIMVRGPRAWVRPGKSAEVMSIQALPIKLILVTTFVYTLLAAAGLDAKDITEHSETLRNSGHQIQKEPEPLNKCAEQDLHQLESDLHEPLPC